MGVGYPLDIVVCSALGADMDDCVYPTCTALFGTALIPEGVLNLKHKAMAKDIRPIDPTCACIVTLFVCNFLQTMFPKGDVPEWVCNAMEVAGIDFSFCCIAFYSSQRFKLEVYTQLR